MKQKTVLSILVLFLLISCVSQNTKDTNGEVTIKPYPHIINITEGFDNSSQIKLSEIADSIRYIVLSGDKQKLIGDISKIQITDSNIYARCNSIIMRFDLNGKFLNSFGNIGRGPDEYLPGSVFTTTPDDEKIYIFRSAMDNYFTYKINGNYLETYDFPVSKTLFDFRNLSDSVFLCTFFYIGSFMKDNIINSINYSAGIFDIKGNPIKVIEHPLKDANFSKSDIRNIVSIAPSVTFFDNRIVLKPAGDTIYEIDSNSIYKGFIIDWGKIPHYKGNEFYFKQASSSNLITIGPVVLETFDRVFLRASGGRILEYNKMTGSTKSMTEDPDNPGIINDLDGGANFYPYYTNRAGDIWIVDDDAYTFKEKHSPEFLDKSMVLHPWMKEKLKIFTDNLKLDDNPVLKILYLKKYPR